MAGLSRMPNPRQRRFAPSSAAIVRRSSVATRRPEQRYSASRGPLQARPRLRGLLHRRGQMASTRLKVVVVGAAVVAGRRGTTTTPGNSMGGGRTTLLRRRQGSSTIRATLPSLNLLHRVEEATMPLRGYPRLETSSRLSDHPEDRTGVGEGVSALHDVAQRKVDLSCLGYQLLPPAANFARQLHHPLRVGGVLAHVANDLTIAREC